MRQRTQGVAEFISGVILQDETIRQRSSKGTPMADLLAEQGIIPGIKVDLGAKSLAGFPGRRRRIHATADSVSMALVYLPRAAALSHFVR